jgi:hypothetical protein
LSSVGRRRWSPVVWLSGRPPTRRVVLAAGEGWKSYEGLLLIDGVPSNGVP